ncbi:sulfotransferase family protein [Myceligenerans salitolerans]|uniref:Sulfotransferase n=1 Tax=Myceligenerans salitolerans TaxID=1230528 RepID=A0ABS3I790_9MICO|nr:sulfotransferase [Myceligenerans salitolerans]MBO0608862.1 sulfotransferase [Myceligenerans salitolerans]
MSRTRTTRASRILNAVLSPVVKGKDDPDGAWADAVGQVDEAAEASDAAAADDFRVLLRSVAAEPRITPLGWILALTDAKGRYTNRLRIQRLVAENPRIAQEPIEDPVFVLGLPRTATTLTHRVLASSPAHRGPLLWEMSYTDLENPEAAERTIKALDRGSKVAGALLAPQMKNMHPTGATMPEETFWLLPHGTFYAGMYGALPSYLDWYGRRSAAELTGDYQFLKQALQVLQHGRERRRWILKYPGHLADMTTIRQVFPDATFVWTHRDPASVVASACSLVETGWAMYQHDPDPLEVGRVVTNWMSSWLTSALEARLTLPPSAIIDVPYHKMSAAPHTEVPQLYAQLGATWTASDAERLDRVIARPAGARPHRYDITRYGLSPARVAESFGDYISLLHHIDVLDLKPGAEL